jgi:5-methylcytosine-specific restriction endonuclease McrA
MITKICTTCNQTKPTSGFYFRKDCNDYRRSCKDCVKLAKAERESKPGVKEQRAIAECKRRVDHKEKINAWLRAYRKTAHSKAVYKKWKTENPERIRNYNRTQRAKRRFALKAEDSATTKEVYNWLQEQSKICTYCGIELTDKITHVDHKIPLSRGGPHTLDNLTLACASCNCSKNNKTPEEFKEYKELIEAKDKKP